jgi:HAD superfamily hydrolase (TIGR01450 family)
MATASFDASRYDAFVFDLDGTVWLGADAPIPGAREFLDGCRDLGATVAFATNAIVHSPETLSAQLVHLGLARPDEPVVTSGTVIVRTLVSEGAALVAGVVPSQLEESLLQAGITVVSPNDVTPDDFGPVGPERALVLASSRTATIGSIERLGRLAAAGHRAYISSKDAGFPIVGGIEPGGGVLFAALTAMYDVDVTILGKPSPQYAAAVAAALGGPARRILVCGDSQRADIGIAHELDCDSVLLTCHSVRPISPDLPAPTYVAPTLGDPFRPHRHPDRTPTEA